MDTTAAKSYDSGISETPLLGDTIGDDLDRTAARVPSNGAGRRSACLRRDRGVRGTVSAVITL